MGFITGLSGLRVSKTDLDTVGNNVANAGTTAFKKSRTEAGDVYSNSYFSSGRTEPGSGVTTERVAQLKTQGHNAETNKPLDLAIDGRGYFIIKQNDTQMYTRDGTFRLNKDGYVTDNTDGFLQGYKLDMNGNVATSLGNIHIEQTNIVAKATSIADLEFNLDYREKVKNLEVDGFDPQDPKTFNYSNVMKIYDSLGGEHDLRYYFVKTGEYETAAEAQRNGINNSNLRFPATIWTVFTSLDGDMFDSKGNIYEPKANDQAKNAQMTLAYDSNGLLQGMARGGSQLERVFSSLNLSKGTGEATAVFTKPTPATATDRYRDGVIKYESTIKVPAANANGSKVIAVTGPGFDKPDGGKLEIKYQAPNPGATPTEVEKWTLTLYDGAVDPANKVGVEYTSVTNNGKAVFTRADGTNYEIDYADLAKADTDITFEEEPHFTFTPKDTGVPEVGVVGTAGNTVTFYGDPATTKGFQFTIPADSQKHFHHGAEYALETKAQQTGNSTLEGFSGNTKFDFNLSKLTQGATYGKLDNEKNGDDIVHMSFASTQTARKSQFSAQSQDGYPPGEIREITVSKEGIMSIHYTNNQSRDIAKIPLATFRNEDDLRPVGSNSYVETKASGSATINDATAGPNGAIKDRHLELSNVDLAEELVQMIIAQRNFQANAKTIQTEDSITQTIINLR